MMGEGTFHFFKIEIHYTTMPKAQRRQGLRPSSLCIRENINEKKRFLSGIARMMGGGLPMSEFFGPLFRSAFWSIKRVYFFKNANVTVFLGCIYTVYYIVYIVFLVLN